MGTPPVADTNALSVKEALSLRYLRSRGVYISGPKDLVDVESVFIQQVVLVTVVRYLSRADALHTITSPPGPLGKIPYIFADDIIHLIVILVNRLNSTFHSQVGGARFLRHVAPSSLDCGGLVPMSKLILRIRHTYLTDESNKLGSEALFDLAILWPQPQENHHQINPLQAM
ncbi:hypothetical protein DMENIID0001_061800 [Sergentomyia squamirostris]